MGAIRLLLAFAVVMGHIQFVVLPPLGIGVNRYLTLGMNAGYAVMFFYVISGFLISYVLEGKYAPTPAGTYRFYKSRAIRIYALYWAVWTLSSVALDPRHGHEIWTGPLRDLLPSLFLFGSDWRVAFGAYPHEYYGFFPIGLNLAWTLGAEMTFYLVAPFLLRSLTATVFVLLMSVAVRAALVHAFGFFESWTYHFFPATVLFFLLGHLSRLLNARLRLPPKAGCAFLLPSLLFSLLTVGRSFDTPYFYLSIACFALSLPGLFALTKDKRALNFMGDISYAVYLTHLLVIMFILPLFEPFLLRSSFLSSRGSVLSYALALLTLALAAAVAAGSEVLVEKPLRFLLGRLCGWGEARLGSAWRRARSAPFSGFAVSAASAAGEAAAARRRGSPGAASETGASGAEGAHRPGAAQPPGAMAQRRSDRS